MTDLFLGVSLESVGDGRAGAEPGVLGCRVQRVVFERPTMEGPVEGNSDGYPGWLVNSSHIRRLGLVAFGNDRSQDTPNALLLTANSRGGTRIATVYAPR